MDLAQYTTGDYSPGAPLWKQLLWYGVGDPLFRCRFLPCSSFKALLLRLFGASIGKNVTLKPDVRIKFPWRLSIGCNSWIGEGVWIDNLACVGIGSNVCVSQGVYLCTGNHDWASESFTLQTKAIELKDHAWLAAQSRVGPGVTVGEGAVLTLGSVTTSDLSAWSIFAGNPAQKIKDRPKTLAAS